VTSAECRYSALAIGCFWPSLKANGEFLIRLDSRSTLGDNFLLTPSPDNHILAEIGYAN